MKKQKEELVMLDLYIDTRQYKSEDQQLAARTRILNALKRAGWPLDAAGFIAKYETEKGNLLKIEGIGPVYESMLVDAANAIYKDLKKNMTKVKKGKTKPKELPVVKPKKK